jgi:hypothetical protein
MIAVIGSLEPAPCAAIMHISSPGPRAGAELEKGYMEDCATDTTAYRDLVNTEYAFGLRARDSVRAAFLEYLAGDAWGLLPTPKPARPFYEAAPQSSDRLEWYPVMADVAGSLDLGFTTGPWIYTAAADGKQLHGNFLTIWKRDPACRWRVAFDAGISHAAPATVLPKLAAEPAAYVNPGAPPPNLVAENAAGHALSDFQVAAEQDGVAAALRTFARTADFHYYTDGEAPMALGAANRYLTEHAVEGSWRESVAGRSADASIAYSVGMLLASGREDSHAYVQVWQYDPRVANWGLRILLINAVPPRR